MKSKALMDFEQIENEFFDITGDIAIVRLHFENPDEVFDVNCLSRTPIFNDDFDDWLQSAFEMIPSKYKIQLEISFDDMGGYTPDQLDDIFSNNLLLSARTLTQSIHRRDNIAIGLMIAGVVSFIAMMLISKLWETESFWHEVFSTSWTSQRLFYSGKRQEFYWSRPGSIA